MFGMIKNSLFGNTEVTEYKLLSSEMQVSGARTPVTHSNFVPSDVSEAMSANAARAP